MDASPGDRILFRSTAATGYGRVGTVTRGAESGPRQLSPLDRVWVYAAAGRGICLRPDGPLATYQLAVLDPALRVRDTYPLAGVPNRARVSPSGNVLAWTVFVTGDSYTGGRFSTRAGMLDLATGETVDSLELFPVVRGAAPPHAVDVNLWGVTFADDQRFYATLSTGGKRYLIAGEIGARSARTLAENVECPSPSPDGTRIAFKEAIGGDPARGWRLSVLDLSTLRRRPLAETRSVDDQAAWYGNDTIMYGVRRGVRDSDVWAVPADGSGTPRLLVPDAESPAALWN
ncbi:TolB-like translocation protein [Actinoplanes siamensis]|uniref:TolB-like translocation protein signal peptide n=1 Tax=Actinoplanes siamensis TaxID=1223317 RepID=A0A919TI18_9ACTN|nr:hypothetical protein [Actinoplanes siamensis]GIF03832.1 TolB-like translocation protein; signal peptide [Actinoplanes siamensis]